MSPIFILLMWGVLHELYKDDEEDEEWLRYRYRRPKEKEPFRICDHIFDIVIIVLALSIVCLASLPGTIHLCRQGHHVSAIFFITGMGGMLAAGIFVAYAVAD